MRIDLVLGLIDRRIIRRGRDILIQISSSAKIVVSPDGLIIGRLVAAAIGIRWSSDNQIFNRIAVIGIRT